MIALDLLRLDREVLEAHEAARRADRAVADGASAATLDPFARFRHVSLKASFVELSGLPSDPLVEGLADWVGHLTLERVTFLDRAAVLETWNDASHRGRSLEGAWSPRRLLAAILREPAEGRRRELAQELAVASARTASAARHASERSREATKLLGARPGAGSWGVGDDAIVESARSLARLAREALGTDDGERWEETIVRGLGRDAGEGWPAAIRPRFVAQVFPGATLMGGLDPKLGTLPDPLGAASFARALGSLGAALAEADRPRGVPFSIARSPDDPLVAKRRALFAGLAAEPAFGRRVLGLGRVAAREQARKIARALVASLRVEALRPLLWAALGEGPRRAIQIADEETAAALGAPLPPTLLGALPAVGRGSARAFAALVLGAADLERMRETFDEDWFENPKAHEALRDEHQQIASSRKVTPEGLAQAVASLGSAVRSSLG
jgi:hypothetical protein